MPADDERPDVIPSTVDPAYECVRADRQTPSGELAAPPAPAPGGAPAVRAQPEPLCPEGYVPRLRRRDYDIDGKRVITGAAPERNPSDPER